MTEGFKFLTIGELHAWVGQEMSAGRLSLDTVVKTSDLYGSTNSNGGGEAVIHPAEGSEPMTLSIYGDFA